MQNMWTQPGHTSIKNNDNMQNDTMKTMKYVRCKGLYYQWHNDINM